MVLRNNQLVDTMFSLPEYDIGYTLGYPDVSKQGGPASFIEASVVGLHLSCDYDERTNKYDTVILYQLDNGDVVDEMDVEYYYEPVQEDAS